jgi:hypothetical protein
VVDWAASGCGEACVYVAAPKGGSACVYCVSVCVRAATLLTNTAILISVCVCVSVCVNTCVCMCVCVCVPKGCVVTTTVREHHKRPLTFIRGAPTLL